MGSKLEDWLIFFWKLNIRCTIVQIIFWKSGLMNGKYFFLWFRTATICEFFRWYLFIDFSVCKFILLIFEQNNPHASTNTIHLLIYSLYCYGSPFLSRSYLFTWRQGDLGSGRQQNVHSHATLWFVGSCGLIYL